MVHFNDRKPNKFNFQQIKDLLTSENWKVNVVKSDENNTIEALKLHFNFPFTDETGEFDVILDTPKLLSTQLKESSDFQALEFSFNFDEKVKREAVLDTYLLLNRMNKNMFVPGFGIHEGSRTVFFRYTFVMDKNISKQFVHNLISILINVVDTCNDTVNQMASGQISFKDVVQKGENEFVEHVLNMFHQVSGL